jgi:hypothetical protein
MMVAQRLAVRHPAGLAFNHMHMAAKNDVADPHLTTSWPRSLLIEKKADGPDLPRFERPLSADLSTDVPTAALTSFWIDF